MLNGMLFIAFTIVELEISILHGQKLEYNLSNILSVCLLAFNLVCSSDLHF